MGGRYRYLLNHAISGEDLEALTSGLEDEAGFRLPELTGVPEWAAMLGAGELAVDVELKERFFAFGGGIEILSVYLPEYVSGLEIVEELDAGLKRTRIECWRYVGRRGELIAVPMQYALSLTREIIVGKEDTKALRAMWPDLPQWARDAYKLTFDELADLDSGGRR